MSSPPCSISVEEEYQKYVSASNQPVLHITHIYTTNPDASDSSPAELSAAAKAVMVQQQKQQQQAKQGEGSTGAIRRSCRQRKRPRYFPPMDVRILAARRCRYKKAANPFALQDALVYIDSVKLAYLPTKPYVYGSFLAAMKVFNDGGVTTKEFMEMIIALFGNDGARGRKCVIGFSAFCPRGWGIRQGDGEGKWVLVMP